MFGAVCAFLSLAAILVPFVRKDVYLARLNDISITYQGMQGHLSHLRGLLDDAKASMMARTPPGEFDVQMLRAAQGSRTDLQALVNALLEISKAVTQIYDRLEGASNPPSSRDPGRPPEQNLTIQRKALEPFSFHGHMNALAKGLARERIQANPDPFLALD